jgi:hypothetical protein
VSVTNINPTGKRSKGHPKNRWRDEVLNDLKKLKGKSLRYHVKDRKAWCTLVQKTKTHQVLIVSAAEKHCVHVTAKAYLQTAAVDEALCACNSQSLSADHSS